MVKNLPAVQETQVQSLSQEGPLREKMAPHSSILAGESHGQRGLAGCSPWGCKEAGMTEHPSTHISSEGHRENCPFLPSLLSASTKWDLNSEASASSRMFFRYNIPYSF